MPYAVVQRSLTAPTSEQLELACSRSPGLTANDAKFMSRRAFGVLAEKISQPTAVALAMALTTAGVPAQAISMEELSRLPQPKSLPRADCENNRLIIYDPFGRASDIAWKRVRVIAVGDVLEMEVNKSSTIKANSGDSRTLYVDTQYKRTEKRIAQVDLLIDGEPNLFHIEADRFQYAYLGSERSPNRRENFLRVVRDLVAYAPGALLNRGAAAVSDGGNDLLRYPSTQAFEQEIIWLLWLTRQPQL